MYSKERAILNSTLRVQGMRTVLHRFFWLAQRLVILKFITSLDKLYMRCKSDVLKAKQSMDLAKTGRKGRKREESGMLSSLAFTPLCKQVSQQKVSTPPMSYDISG